MTRPLTREDVASVYRQVLGREPSDAEIAHQLAGAQTLDAMLRVALDSEEFAARSRAAAQAPSAPPLVNTFHPDLARWCHQPGTLSADEVAIVGQDGWLFLAGGSNSNLEHHLGRGELPPTWLEDWRQVVRERDTQLRALGAAAALLVVPDKLAVYEDRYPEPLTPVGPRPVERLLDAGGIPLVYPLPELRAAAREQEVYLRTDTHLTYQGNRVLFDAVAGALGLTTPLDLSGLADVSYPTHGDLGVKFDPPIVGVVHTPGTLRHARITEDNHAAIAAVQGHIGTRRVFVNDQAPDDRVCVLFGDSFGFAAEHYQGLAWFLAQMFRETHFVWVPFGWDPDYARTVGARAVLIQGAERFVGRAPHVAVDVTRLAEETMRRKQGLGLEAALKD